MMLDAKLIGQISMICKIDWSDLYDMSRETYIMWKNAGSPKQGSLSDMKNRAKARFKGAMRFIRSNEGALRKESLAKKLLCKTAFWKIN